MRFGSCGLGMLMGAALLALAGCSDDEPAVANDSGQAGNGVCLATAQIDHTDIVNDKAIVFFMKDGKAYMNAMGISCPSLQMEGGFTFMTDAVEVCSNSQTIRVKNSGNFCELGQFTPFAPPKMPEASTAAQ